MNRLTERDPKDGLAYTEIALNTSCIYDDVKQQFHACYTGFIADRLADYEDTDMIPKDIKNMEKNYIELQRKFQQAMIKLEEYKDLEAEGRLIKLPCKFGDTVYAIDAKGNIHECKVYNITTNVYANESKGSPYWVGFEIKSHLFGKSVFLTREEAEKALEAQDV